MCGCILVEGSASNIFFMGIVMQYWLLKKKGRILSAFSDFRNTNISFLSFTAKYVRVLYPVYDHWD